MINDPYLIPGSNYCSRCDFGIIIIRSSLFTLNITEIESYHEN